MFNSIFFRNLVCFITIKDAMISEIDRINWNKTKAFFSLPWFGEFKLTAIPVVKGLNELIIIAGCNPKMIPIIIIERKKPAIELAFWYSMAILTSTMDWKYRIKNRAKRTARNQTIADSIIDSVMKKLRRVPGLAPLTLRMPTSFGVLRFGQSWDSDSSGRLIQKLNLLYL